MKRIFWIWLCLLVCFSVFATEMSINVDIEKDMVVENTILSDAILAGTQDAKFLYDDFVGSYLPIIPPSPSEMFLQPVRRLVVFDQAGFDSRFLSNLVGEMHPVSGAPVYTIYAMMDASTFDVVLFNENLLELARIPRTKAYSPFSWVESRFGTDLTPELMALYNPARMIAEYRLIPSSYVEYHAAAMEQALAAQSEAMDMMAMGAGDGSTNMVVSFSADTNGIVSLAFTPPIGFGPCAEIFKKQNLLLPSLWSVAENRMAVTNGVETVWCSSLSNPTMFFIVGNTSAGFDDGDGYSELRERHVEGSNPFVFDMRDTDSDNMHDWFEVMYFSDLTQTGNDDFDGDGLQNNVEMVLHPAEGTNSAYVTFSSDPSLYDTDGDGTDDGTEVSQGSDPLNSADGGQPTATNATTVVTFFLQSAYAEVPITMTLSDETNSYTLVSTGTEMTSNSHDVVTGRSYTLSLEQDAIVPLAAGGTGYFADVSGAGVVKVDPMEILGIHTTDLSQGVNTAAVHVVKTNNVFVGFGDGSSVSSQNQLIDYLTSIDATADENAVWIYAPSNSARRIEVKLVDEGGFVEGLNKKGAYVAFDGHSNFGVGLAWNDAYFSANDFLNVGDSARL